jgi:membrane-associated protein
MAGVGRMRFSLYALYSVIGGILWADGVLLLGHQLGKITFVREHKGWVDAMVLIVIVLALVPAAIHYVHGRKRRPEPAEPAVPRPAGKPDR